MERKPVNFVSWEDAARYVNWLTNGQPTGAQGPSTTESGTYDMSVPNAGATVMRAPASSWFLPTVAEWELAAYLDPFAGVNWTYPTRSDDVPVAAEADGSGAVVNQGTNVANYANGAVWAGQNGHVTNVGGCGPLSTNAAGTYDQAGNVAEWTESQGQGNTREVAGGGFDDDAAASTTGSAEMVNNTNERRDIGFRVASTIPAS